MGYSAEHLKSQKYQKKVFNNSNIYGPWIKHMFFSIKVNKSQKFPMSKKEKNQLDAKLRNHRALKHERPFKQIFKNNNIKITKQKWVGHDHFIKG